MDSQADTVITDAGRELVCSCIKDDELRAHMFKHMGMADGSLCKIIGDSLKTLDEKRTMLEQLRKEVSSDYAEAIDSGLEQLDTALDMLYNVDRDRGILLVSGVFYSEEERGHDTFDGPFPVASWDAAQTLMKQYVDDDPDEDWSESFWQIKLYTAERYIGDLPDDCSFMLELSKKLHDDPSYGKQWSDGSIVHDCLQPYRTSTGAGVNAIRSDILEFLDSPDIREHLEGISYEPTTPEAAFIVDRSSEKTLQQKIEAWQKILENMPNCAMNRRYGTFNIPNFHVFLRDVIKWERKIISSRYGILPYPAQAGGENSVRRAGISRRQSGS